MTEAEILYQMSVDRELLFGLLQWWLSVTIGLLALAHFFANKLNLILLILLLGAYLIFTGFVANEAGYLISQRSLFSEQLRTLMVNGGIGPAAEGAIESGNIERGPLLGMAFAMITLQLGSIFYVIIRFVRVRREDGAGAA